MSEPLIRNNWVEISSKFGFAFEYEVAGYFDERPVLYIWLGWPQIFIHLPFKTGINECESPRFGIYYFEDTIVLLFWRWQKHIYMPWSFKHYKKWEQVVDEWKGTFFVEVPNRMQYGFLGTKQIYDYEYILRSGKVQNRKATIYVDKMEWRRLWLPWFPLFNKVRTCISVEFDGEVGEETGSWKGGCTGCGYEMKDGETPFQTLRRMEMERKF